MLYVQERKLNLILYFRFNTTEQGFVQMVYHVAMKLSNATIDWNYTNFFQDL